MFLAVQRCAQAARGVPRRADAAGRGRRRQHQPDAAARRRAEAVRACTRLGAVRLRQQLDLRRHTQELQVALLRRYVANVIEEIRLEIPLNRITHVIAIGGDVRFAASQIARRRRRTEPVREIPRERFLAFCDEVERLDEDGVVDRFRLPAVEAETLVPALLVYRALLSETAARQRGRFPTRRCAPAVLLDVAEPGGRVSAEDFEQQVLASADALGHRYRFDREHGHHVADARCPPVRRAARRARPRRSRAAAAAGRRPAARRRHLRQPARASQAFAVHPGRVADLRPVRRRDGDRLEHRPLSPPRACRSAATCRTSRSTGRTG